MEMSIDKTIEFFNGLECHTPQATDAKNVALESMRKCKKITSILKTAKADPTRDEYAEYYLDKIEEVIRWSPT